MPNEIPAELQCQPEKLENTAGREIYFCRECGYTYTKPGDENLRPGLCAQKERRSGAIDRRDYDDD